MRQSQVSTQRVAPVFEVSDILSLALEAYTNSNIYRQKNVEANRRGDCKENVERLLMFFRAASVNLAALSVLYLRMIDEDGFPASLPVDKAALRSEERAIVLRHIFTGKYRRHQMFWKLHLCVITQSGQVFDLSARQDLLGIPFPIYFQTLFSIALNQSGEETMNAIQVSMCSAEKYLAHPSPFADEFLPRFSSTSLNHLLNEKPLA